MQQALPRSVGQDSHSGGDTARARARAGSMGCRIGRARLLCALVCFLSLPAVSAAGIRAAYGAGANKTWEGAQKQCEEWGGSLLKAEGEWLDRLPGVKCTDVLWVGAHESPKSYGVNIAYWRWVADASSVAGDSWWDSEPNNDLGLEEDCGFVGLKFTDVGFDRILELLRYARPIGTDPGGMGLGAHRCDAKLPFACDIPSIINDEMVWLTTEGTMEELGSCDRVEEQCLYTRRCVEQKSWIAPCYALWVVGERSHKSGISDLCFVFARSPDFSTF